MKFHVNERCIGCGLCVGICPEVFEMDDGKAFVKARAEEGVISAKAAEACAGCPVDAIEKR